MLLCNDNNDVRVMQSMVQALLELTAENKELKQELMAKSEKIKEQKNLLITASRKNRETQEEVHELQQKLHETKHELQLVKTAREHHEAQFERWQTESREQNASITVLLQDLTSMLISLQNEAEQAASALREAQEPAETRYRSEHSQLLKQMKKMHSQLHTTSARTIAAETKAAEASAELSVLQQAFQKLQISAEPESVQIQKFCHTDKNWQTFTDHDWEIWVRNPSIQGTYFKQKHQQVNNSPVYKKHTRDSTKTPLYIVKNTDSQWSVVTQNGTCLALDPERKISPWNCDWHEFDEKGREYVRMETSHPSGFCA
jgi:hypothetical protein